MFGVIYAGESSFGHKVSVVQRPSIIAAQEQVENTVQIPGRVYGLAERSGYYNDVEISVDFNYVAKDPNHWTAIYRDCVAWLRKKGELKFTDDLSAFYRVRYVNVGENERANKRIGRFTATFVCQPGTYFETGKQWLELTVPDGSDHIELYNYHSQSQPIYQIIGTGECTLTVNGNTVTGTVANTMTIDTDLWLCYNDEIQDNVSVTGDYDGLYLMPEKNVITISEGFKLSVKPNWRML